MQPFKASGTTLFFKAFTERRFRIVFPVVWKDFPNFDNYENNVNFVIRCIRASSNIEGNVMAKGVWEGGH